MACEAEQARVDQLSAQYSSKAAYAASVCAARGQQSTECQGARGEASALLSELAHAQGELAKCHGDHPDAAARLLEATGYVTFLRVNEPGSGYGGGSTNWFDADVIFKLHSRPDKAFGLQLRDENVAIRRGMLALLEDAIVNRLQVITDYVEQPTTPNSNCFVIRVALLQTPPSRPPSRPESIDEVMG